MCTAQTVPSFTPVGRIRRKARGFTLLELLVAIALFSILGLIAVPNLANWRGNLNVSADTRLVFGELQQIRSEAIRMRSEITVNFSTTGLSWTVDGEASPRRTLVFSQQVRWSGATPASLVFNGLGLIPALTTNRTMTLTDGRTVLQVVINPNGHVTI
jgi:prepilin-type N-terminal cleavage/methylation domain-containing protein